MKVIGIGEVVWDMLPGGKQLGGAPVNFLYFCAQLGLQAYPVSAIGNDDLGKETLQALQKAGMDLSYIQRNNLPTSRVLVTLDASGVPSYEIVENVAWDAIECPQQALELVSDADALCWGSLAQRSETSRKSILRLVDATPASCKKVFDINIRQHYYSLELVEASLNRCDILKLNEDELPLLQELFALSLTPAELIAQLIVRYRIEQVIYTQGAICSDIYDKSGLISHIDTPKVKVVDTVGAGDSFTAAYVSSILQGKSVGEAHRLAVDISAQVCTMSGAINICLNRIGYCQYYCLNLRRNFGQ